MRLTAVNKEPLPTTLTADQLNQMTSSRPLTLGFEEVAGGKRVEHTWNVEVFSFIPLN